MITATDTDTPIVTVDSIIDEYNDRYADQPIGPLTRVAILRDVARISRPQSKGGNKPRRTDLELLAFHLDYISGFPPAVLARFFAVNAVWFRKMVDRGYDLDRRLSGQDVAEEDAIQDEGDVAGPPLLRRQRRTFLDRTPGVAVPR